MSYNGAPIGPLVFSDGTIIEIPHMRVSNGWVARPQAAIDDTSYWRGRPDRGQKTFGRAYSSNGWERAGNWFESWIKRQMPPNATLLSSGSLLVGTRQISYDSNLWTVWDNKPYGPVQIGLRIREDSDHWKLVTSLWTSKLISDYPVLTLDSVHSRHTETLNQIDLVSKEEVYSAVEAFREDPFRYLSRSNLPYGRLTRPDEFEVEYDSTGERWLDRRYPERVFTENAEALADLASLYSWLGARLNIHYGNYGASRTVTSLGVDVPATKHEHNSLGHTIRFDANGIHVVCGYVSDEERWVEYQKRQAENFLGELFGEEETTQEEEPQFIEFEINMSKEDK